MSALSLARIALTHGNTESCRRMDDFVERVPHIGIVAGTAEGAALCYRTLCQEAEGVMGRRYDHPEVTLHSLSLHRYLDAIDRDDWAAVAALMATSAAKLAQVGADVIICPNNTLHKALSLVKPPVPWVHIARPVVREIEASRWHRVAVLGTRTVMEGDIYAQRLRQANIDVTIPKIQDRIRIQHIIRSELVAGLFTDESRQFLLSVISQMADEGAEAVILGCTELPLLLSEHRGTVPLLDSTRMLARAALSYGVQVGTHQVRRRVVPSASQGELLAEQN